MTKITTLLNSDYFPLFTGFYNSIRFYGNKETIKVINWDRLNNFQLEYLSKFVEIQTPDYNQIIDKNNVSKYYQRLAYIPLNLTQSLEDYELKLDVDMLVLNNLQEVFDDMHKGNFVGSSESQYKPINYFPDQSEINNQNVYINKFKKHIPDKYLNKYSPTNDVKIFNGGFSGLVRDKHFDLLEMTYKTLEDSSVSNDNAVMLNDQTMFSFLLSLSGIDIVDKPKTEWMNLWYDHSNPRKGIKLNNDNTFNLYNVNGERVNLYHLTAGVYLEDMYKDGMFLTIRTFHTTQDYFKIAPLKYNEDQLRDITFHMWKDKHKSPIMFLNDYFQNNGEFKTPMVYNIKFRKIIAQMCSMHFGGEFDIESKEVLAVAIAYDYITLLDYTMEHLDWIENILIRLFDIYNGKYTKDNDNFKKIGWNSPNCDVSLSFNSVPIWKYWRNNASCFVESNVEMINNLFITHKI